MAKIFPGALRTTLKAAGSLAAGLVMMATAPAVQAQGSQHPQFYGSLAYGIATATNCGSDTVSCDRSTMVTKLFGGYRLTPSLATEVSYWYFGSMDRAFAGRVEFDEKSRQNINIAADSTKYRAFGLGVNYEAELFDIFTNHLRIGLAYGRDERNITLAGNQPLQGSRDKDRYFPYAGVGLSYQFHPNFRLTSGIDLLLHNDRTFFTATVGATGEF